MPARLAFRIEQHALDAGAVEQEREHEADRPAADDADRRAAPYGLCLLHGYCDSPSMLRSAQY
jgi:hypothetical protein